MCDLASHTGDTLFMWCTNCVFESVGSVMDHRQTVDADCGAGGHVNVDHEGQGVWQRIATMLI